MCAYVVVLASVHWLWWQFSSKVACFTSWSWNSGNLTLLTICVEQRYQINLNKFEVVCLNLACKCFEFALAYPLCRTALTSLRWKMCRESRKKDTASKAWRRMHESSIRAKSSFCVAVFFCFGPHHSLGTGGDRAEKPDTNNNNTKLLQESYSDAQDFDKAVRTKPHCAHWTSSAHINGTPIFSSSQQFPHCIWTGSSNVRFNANTALFVHSLHTEWGQNHHVPLQRHLHQVKLPSSAESSYIFCS